MSKLASKQILGIIDATTTFNSLADLTVNRSIASLPFAGRYRLIDFVLSSMAHAGLDSVGVFSHSLNNSLKGHLASGDVWDLNRKNGGLFFYVQDSRDEEDTRNILFKNSEFIKRAPYEYVLVAPCHLVGNLSILEMHEAHIKGGTKVTQLTHENKKIPVYLVERELLVNAIEIYDGGRCSFIEFIQHGIKDETVNLFEEKNRVLTIDTFDSYYEASMSLLDHSNFKTIFKENAPVLTKTIDAPPTKYYTGSQVTGSIVANGCQISGQVSNSIISRSVEIGKNTDIRNCIVMPKVKIAEDCIFENVIIDKDVITEAGVVMKGKIDAPLVIRKGVTVYKEWN